jgi:hypothetical protein
MGPQEFCSVLALHLRNLGRGVDFSTTCVKTHVYPSAGWRVWGAKDDGGLEMQRMPVEQAGAEKSGSSSPSSVPQDAVGPC